MLGAGQSRAGLQAGRGRDDGSGAAERRRAGSLCRARPAGRPADRYGDRGLPGRRRRLGGPRCKLGIHTHSGAQRGDLPQLLHHCGRHAPAARRFLAQRRASHSSRSCPGGPARPGLAARGLQRPRLFDLARQPQHRRGGRRDPLRGVPDQRPPPQGALRPAAERAGASTRQSPAALHRRRGELAHRPAARLADDPPLSHRRSGPLAPRPLVGILGRRAGAVRRLGVA